MAMGSDDQPTSAESPAARPGPSSSSDEESLVGVVLNETYRVERLVGEGGMSRVYEACHTRLPHKRYALKVLHADLSRSEDLLARFQREAEAVSSLSHDSILSIHDVGVTPQGVPFMVCEFLDGRDLAAVLTATPKLEPLFAVRLARKVAAALVVAHESGVVHRDLKPENVFVLGEGPDPEIKVIDFGLSRFVDGSRSTMTQAGVVMGTPAYMSPEQARGERGDHRTDIYGVGVLLYTSLTGQPPFEEESPQQTVLAAMSREPARPKTLVPSLPDSVELVIQRAMARDPNDRYQKMQDLYSALTTLEEQLSITRQVAGPRVTQVSILVQESEDDARFGRLRLMGLLVAGTITTWSILALAAIAGATWIAKRELTTTELSIALLGVLGTALTPILLLTLRVKRRVWNNSAKVADAVAALRGPLVSALIAYGVLMLVLRVVRYVGRSGWPSAWVGWDLILLAVVSAWALSSLAARRAARVVTAWRRAVLVMGVRSLALVVTVGGLAYGLRSTQPLGVVAEAPVSPTAEASAAPAVRAPATASGGIEPAPAAVARDASLDGAIIAAQREGLDALRALATQHPGDAQVLRAWAVAAASDSGQTREATVAFGQLFERAPAQAGDPALRPLLLKLAHGSDSDAALDLMATRMGSQGPDLLYDLYLTAPTLRDAVRLRLQAPATRERASPALAIAFDFRVAPSCSARIALLPRAESEGDDRALTALAAYSTGTKKGCGARKKSPCPPVCAAEAAAFRRSMQVMNERFSREKQDKR
ncbi:MAG: protein kinase [Polyangiaceae bacterium]|nr:protein kinase [Polyangiaceae bacterium]